MNIQDLEERNLILLDCISGSRAYGLATPESDTDVKGVFLLPKKELLQLNIIAQVNNPSNDIVYYELGRFIELLSVNNPNILELLATPASAVQFKHPFISEIKEEAILSKLCEKTFGYFALAQIKKAKGMNKKIFNPIAKKRKNILAFCYVYENEKSLPLNYFLEKNGWDQSACGLVRLKHMKNLYKLFHEEGEKVSGIMKQEDANEVSTSSIPEEWKAKTILYFNKEGYSTYCKDYKNYWGWVEKRNEQRYQNTIDNGKNYDAKNMMHTFRLLHMAIEIAKTGRVQVDRSHDRDFLLEIKKGAFQFDELMVLAKEKQKELKRAFANSSLQEKPNAAELLKLAASLRERFYQEGLDQR